MWYIPFVQKMQEQVTGSSTDHGSVSNVENSVIPERQSPEVQSASLSSASGGSASESHTEKLKRYVFVANVSALPGMFSHTTYLGNN